VSASAVMETRPPGPPVSQWTPKLPAATEPQAASGRGAARWQAPAGGKLERRTAPSSRRRRARVTATGIMMCQRRL
jgi:hypothetical protein